MIYRYGIDSHGRRIKSASVYTREEHPLRKNMISPQALHVVRTLHKAGFQAYIVGGAVRDLLLNKIPKDFDVATDASPNRIKKIFSNAWIIGKRFKLAHVVFPGRYIVEVTTFRSVSSDNFNAVYGTIDEDVKRRDFSVNALFFDPEKEQLVDYVGGYKDLKSHRLSNVIPLKTIFDSDPVRMLRAAKYAAKCELKIPLPIRMTIRKKAQMLSSVSVSRLTEEFFKILSSGKAAPIFLQTEKLNLLRYFLPEAAALISRSGTVRDCFYDELRQLDEETACASENGVGREMMMFRFLKPFLPPFNPRLGFFENCVEKKGFCKSLQTPLQWPVAPVEAAIKLIFEIRDGVTLSGKQNGRKKSSRRRPRRKKNPDTSAGSDSLSSGEKKAAGKSE